MTVAIGAAPATLPMRMTIADARGGRVLKTTQLAGDTTDTILLQILNDTNDLSNGAFSAVTVGGRKVTGMNAAASFAMYPEVSDLVEITFTRTNPVNTAKNILKSYLIPAPLTAIVATDRSLIVGTPGTGSATDKLARLIANLAASLAFIGSDGVAYSGGFTFVASMSKKVGNVEV